MWTPEHRRAASRDGLRYPSDLTDDEWSVVAPMIPPARRGGRKRSVNVREVLKGIFYVLWTGCQWKALPKDFPPKSTDEALRNTIEAVRLWAGDAIDDSEGLPPPRSAEVLRADPEIVAALAEGAALAFVPVLLDAGRAVRANLSLDAGLLDAIDKAAKVHGLTRSAFLASAAREKIEGRAVPRGGGGRHPKKRRV